MFDFGRVSPFEEEWAIHQKSKRVYRGGVSAFPGETTSRHDLQVNLIRWFTLTPTENRRVRIDTVFTLCGVLRRTL